MPKVTVVVPVYNVEKYIGKLIESVQQQTLEDIELVLVDDGSPDGSGSVCDKYAESDKRISVIHKKNGGVSAARNDGLAVATGKYVIFCDSDDWLPLNALESLYSEASRTNADIVIGDVYQNLEGKDTRAQFYKEPFVTDDRKFIERLIQTVFYKTYCPCPAEGGPAFGYGGPWNKLVRRRMLMDNDIKFDVRVKGIYDDLIYSAYILANSKTVAYITVPVYYYRLIPTSITRTFKANALEINDAIFNSWREFRRKYDKTGLLEKPFQANVIRRFVETLPIYFLSQKNPKSLGSRMGEMKAVMHSEPYATAIKEVDHSKLSTFQKQVHNLMESGSPYLIWILFKTKTFVKTLLGRNV